MIEVVKLENKQIIIGEKEYRLTITKKRLQYTGIIGYRAFLSDVNSQYTHTKSFDNANQLNKGLRAWIIQADILNDPESRVFEELQRWDGVINI